MMEDNSVGSPKAIGVFDSGVGGLTVLKALINRFPNESFIYLGDTAHLPYGAKSPETITRLVDQNIKFLAKNGVKAAVVACNSASTVITEDTMHGIPIYNVIDPGAQAAVNASHSGKIGILGTRATVKSASYPTRIKNLNPEAKVVSQACPLFVPFAEEGLQDDPLTNLIVYRYLTPLLQETVDTIVLGCTHYPILKASIAKVTGPNIALVDSGEAIADQIQADFDSGKLEKSTDSPTLKLSVTDETDFFMQLAKMILGTDNAQEILRVNPTDPDCSIW
jgi:glutamate racemase